MYPVAATAARGSFRVVTASTKKGKIWTAQGSINRSSSNGSSIRSIRSSSSSRNSSGAHRSGSVRNSSTSCTSNGVGQRAINSCAAWSTHAMPRAARDRVVKRALCTSASGIGSSGGSSGGRGGGARSGGGASSVEFVAAAAAAAAAAVLLSVREFSNHGEEGLCLCKPTVTAEDSIQDYARRLQRLRSLRDIFEEYATVNTDDVGKLMTCGDFLRAMLCYKYVRVGSRELKRRCARYVNPLLGDVHGLISFDEFCFLLSLLSIPAGLFDVAFAAADSDGNGTIDVDELHMLVKRLVPTAGDDDDDDDANENANANTNAGGASAGEKTAEGSDGNPEQQQQQQQRKMKGHRRLAAAWFGEDGTGSVPRERFAAFVRDLRLDVKTVECRLYSSAAIPADEQPGEGPDGAPLAGAPRLWSWWWPPSWLGARGAAAATGDGLSGESGGLAGAAAAGGSGSGSSCGMGGGDEGRDMEGWWSRYEKETISMADLALTLVSTCHPREMPALLTRVQAIRKKRAQIPLRDALLLHEVLEDHAQDLEDALGLYSKASSGGAIGLDEFARAAKIVSGKDLRPECVWLVFKMFDSRGDGRLQHSELREATHDRLRRLPGHNDSPNTFTRFVQCVRGDL